MTRYTRQQHQQNVQATYLYCFTYLSHCSEVFDDGRHGAKNVVEREEPDGSKIKTGAQGYALFRQGIPPTTDAKDGAGVRISRNGYRTEVSVSEYTPPRRFASSTPRALFHPLMNLYLVTHCRRVRLQLFSAGVGDYSASFARRGH